MLSSPVHAEHTWHVVTSFSIIGDMVRQVAGNEMDIKTLVGPNGDVHEYEPSPADAKTLADADIVFINGLGLEGWIERLIQSSGYKGKVIVLTKDITVIQTSGHADPHAWQNPRNAIIYVANIKNALVAMDKIHASLYEINAASYTDKLRKLDVWAENEIAKIPEDKRKVISQHDAFQYFAARYGVSFIAPLGISTDSQASAQDLAKIIDQIRKQKITAVFFENMSDPRLIKQLEADAGAHIGGMLYSDALSEIGGNASNYIDMLRHNVMELVSAMQGNPKR